MRFLAVLAFFLSFSTQAFACLPSATLSRLAAKFTNKVYQIGQARMIAAEFGYRVSTYGGTSREVFRKICEEVAKQGLEQFEKKLADPRTDIKLIDFHKLNSDLDIMLIAEEGAKPEDFAKVEKAIAIVFPGSALYKKMDITLASDFFRKHPPELEHYEAISNIPISDRGVESLPELKVILASGQEVQLDRWGLEQISKRNFEFRINPKFEDETPAFGLAKQALRWIRYLAEEPKYTQDPESEVALHALIHELKTKHNEALVKLLVAGDSELSYQTIPKSLGAKLIDALEKLQLYSRDPIRSHALIESSGFADFLRQAEIAQKRILVPLRPRDPNISTKGKKRLGKSVVVQHYGAINAIQSMSSGALYASDNVSIIQGQVTADDLRQKGLYAAENQLSRGYKNSANFIEITLSPDAVDGVDYVIGPGVFGPEYCIKTLNAIEKNSDGSLKVSPVNFESIINLSFNSILHGKDSQEIAIAKRSLSDLLYPMENPHDAKVVFDLAKRARVAASERAEAEIFDAVSSRPELAFEAIFFEHQAGRSEEQKKLLERVLSSNETAKIDLRYAIEKNKLKLASNPLALKQGIAKLVQLSQKSNDPQSLETIASNILRLTQPKRASDAMNSFMKIVADSSPALQAALRWKHHDKEIGFERVFFPKRLIQGVPAEKRSIIANYSAVNANDLWYLHSEIKKNEAELDANPKAKEHGLKLLLEAFQTAKSRREKIDYARSIVALIRPEHSKDNFRQYSKVLQQIEAKDRSIFFDYFWDNNPAKVVRYAFGIAKAELAQMAEPEAQEILTALKDDALDIIERKREVIDRFGNEHKNFDGIREAMRSQASVISKTEIYKSLLEGPSRPIQVAILNDTNIPASDQESFLIQRYPLMSDQDKSEAIDRVLINKKLKSSAVFRTIIENSNSTQLAKLSYNTERFRSLYHQLDDEALHLLIERGGGPMAIELAKNMAQNMHYNPARAHNGYGIGHKADTKIRARLASSLPRLDDTAVASLSSLDEKEVTAIATHKGEAFVSLPKLAGAVAEKMNASEMYRLYTNGGAESFWRSPELIKIYLRRASLYCLSGFYKESLKHPEVYKTVPNLLERFSESYSERTLSASDLDLHLAAPSKTYEVAADVVFSDFPELHSEFEEARSRKPWPPAKNAKPELTNKATPTDHASAPNFATPKNNKLLKTGKLRRLCRWVLSLIEF